MTVNWLKGHMEQTTDSKQSEDEIMKVIYVTKVSNLSARVSGATRRLVLRRLKETIS